MAGQPGLRVHHRGRLRVELADRLPGPQPLRAVLGRRPERRRARAQRAAAGARAPASDGRGGAGRGRHGRRGAQHRRRAGDRVLRLRDRCCSALATAARWPRPRTCTGPRDVDEFGRADCWVAIAVATDAQWAALRGRDRTARTGRWTPNWLDDAGRRAQHDVIDDAAGRVVPARAAATRSSKRSGRQAFRWPR